MAVTVDAQPVYPDRYQRRMLTFTAIGGEDSHQHLETGIQYAGMQHMARQLGGNGLRQFQPGQGAQPMGPDICDALKRRTILQRHVAGQLVMLLTAEATLSLRLELGNIQLLLCIKGRRAGQAPHGMQYPGIIAQTNPALDREAAVLGIKGKSQAFEVILFKHQRRTNFQPFDLESLGRRLFRAKPGAPRRQRHFSVAGCRHHCGAPHDVIGQVRLRRSANRLVEESMITANICAGRTLRDKFETGVGIRSVAG